MRGVLNASSCAWKGSDCDAVALLLSSIVKVASYNVNCFCGSHGWGDKLSPADGFRLQFHHVREITSFLRRAEHGLLAIQELPAGWMGPGQRDICDYLLGELERMGYEILHSEAAQVCLCVPLAWTDEAPTCEDIWLPARVRRAVGTC